MSNSKNHMHTINSQLKYHASIAPSYEGRLVAIYKDKGVLRLLSQDS